MAAASNNTFGLTVRRGMRCVIYTRKSTEEGLEQEFNTLDAQRDSAEAYIRSQREDGWVALPDRYDDGGYTGANMERPALKKLLQDARDGLIDCVMVYKVDRLTRSLLDFARIMEVLDKHGVSFVSVTQQFTTTGLNRPGFAGGRLLAVTPPWLGSPARRSNGSRLPPEGCCQWVPVIFDD